MSDKKDQQEMDPEIAKQLLEASQDFNKPLNFDVDKDAQQALIALQQNQEKQQSSKENLMNPFQDLQGPDGIQKFKNMFGSQEFQKMNQQMMQFFADASNNMPKDGDPTAAFGMGGLPTSQMFSPQMLQAMLGGGMVPNPQPQEDQKSNASTNSTQSKLDQSNPFMQSYLDMQSQAISQMPVFADGMKAMLENIGDFKNPQEFMTKFMGQFQDFMKSNESNPDIQSFMQNMMQDMMNKETLYPHMKQLSIELPAWLETNSSKLSIEDIEKYNKQLDAIENLVSLFEKDFAPIDKFNEEDALMIQKFQQENTQLIENMKKSGATQEEISAAINKRPRPQADVKQLQQRKKIADPIIEKMTNLLQQLQEAGELPNQIVQKVSVKRMNQQMNMFQEMMEKDQLLGKPEV